MCRAVGVVDITAGCLAHTTYATFFYTPGNENDKDELLQSNQESSDESDDEKSDFEIQNVSNLQGAIPEAEISDESCHPVYGLPLEQAFNLEKISVKLVSLMFILN